MFISNKVYRDFKANKARWISPMTKKALGANELLCDNHNNQAKRHVFFNFREWFIHDRERLIYDKIWYIEKIKWTCESYTYHAIILPLKVRLISISISIFKPCKWHCAFSQNNCVFKVQVWLNSSRNFSVWFVNSLRRINPLLHWITWKLHLS